MDGVTHCRNSFSISTGDRWSISPWSLRWLNQSMYSAVAIFQIVDACPGAFVADQFGFIEGVERFREGVIGVADRTDRGGEAFERHRFGETHGGVLAGLSGCGPVATTPS